MSTTSDQVSRAKGSEPTSKVEEAYTKILALITEGSLVGGDRLPSETEMASRFGISRPVIRQALTRLEQIGVVKVRWGSGTYVQDASGATGDPTFGPVRSLEDVRYTYELRAAVEGEAAALAAEHRLPAPIATARRALDKLENALATDVIAQEADLEFHFAIASASGNPFFPRVMRSIQPSLMFSINLTRTLSLTFPEQRRLLIHREHIDVIEAIEAGNRDAARDRMRHHLAMAWKRLLRGPDTMDNR